MKFYQTLVMTVIAILCLSVVSYGQITTPRGPSPQAKVQQTIGISTVSVDYSRPSVREREIWGTLVPYGWNIQGFGLGNSAPWRAGANENSVITFSHDVKVQGQDVPSGTYGIFFVINEDNSGEVVLSKDYRSWGSYFYVAENDQMRADITIRDNDHVEILTYDFINLDKNSAELVLNWEKKQFPVKIEYATDEIVMANAAEELKGWTGFFQPGFPSAAQYSLQNNVQLEAGLSYIDQALAGNPSFNNKTIKAGLLTALDRESEADELMAGAIEGSNEQELNTYGYMLLGQQKFDKAITMFKMNTDRFPESANAWDSLGEGYALKGDNKEAIKSFKKSLSLNPPANVKANSEKYLRQLGAMD